MSFYGLDFILTLQFCTENSSYFSLKDIKNYAQGYVSYFVKLLSFSLIKSLVYLKGVLKFKLCEHIK